MLTKEEDFVLFEGKSFFCSCGDVQRGDSGCCCLVKSGAGFCLLILQDFGLEFLFELHMEKVSCEVLPFNLPVM